MAAFAVLRFINRKSLTYLNCLKGGICNEKADEHSKEGFYGTGGSCAGGSYHISSFHWFAQPVEPEELRNYVNKK